MEKQDSKICVKVNTKTALDKLGNFRETYDDIIQRLLKSYAMKKK